MPEYTFTFFEIYTMILTEKQLSTQEAIIKRLYPWVSMEEAKKKESQKFWCILCYDYYIEYGQKKPLWDKIYTKVIKTNLDSTDWYSINDDYIWRHYPDKAYWSWDNVIGLPPTLSRVLTALWNCCYLDWSIFIVILRATAKNICKRKLLNEDMTECTLRDQSIETQDIVHFFLCED